MSSATARRQLAEVGGAAPHEARHVAAAMLLDVPVVEATALPRLKAGELASLGHVELGPERWTYEDVYNRALISLVGSMGERDDWPPPHPSHPSMEGKVPAQAHNDGARLYKAIEALGLDELGYEVLVEESRILSKRRDFRRLEVGVSHLLGQGHVIGPDVLERVQEITRRETKTFPGSAEAVGETGRFVALVDVHAPDHGGDTDRVDSGAFDQTIKRWQDSGEHIPLYWREIPSSRELIGSVDPGTLRNQGGFGPSFEARVDLEGEHRTEAQKAWIAVKSKGVEFGLDYVLLANDEDDGIRTLEEVDVTGLTLKPTREGREAIREARTLEERELKQKSREVWLETLIGHDLYADLQARKEQPEPEPEPRVPTDAELREQCKALGLAVPAPRPRPRERPPLSLDEVRAEAEATITAQLIGARDGYAA